MKKYDLLAVEFITKISQININKLLVFKIDSQGKRVLNNRTKIVKLAKIELSNLLNSYKESTVKSIISVYNKHLITNELGIVKEVLKALFIPYYNSINSDYKERLEYRTNNAIFLKNGTDLINLASNFIQSYDYAKITIGLAILTGRRTSEILKTATFEKVNENHILFGGQIKQNNSKCYIIPVLCNSDLIIKALDNLRIIKSYKSIKSVNEREASILNKSVKKYLKKWSKTLKMHDLRRVYAYVCYHFAFYEKAKQDNRQTFDGYTMEILGHRTLKSGESYKVLEVEM